MKRGFKFGIFVLVIVTLLAWFVMAAMSAPAPFFALNSTRNYDKEGNFTINWTNVSDGIGNNATHNLYINFTNGTVFQTKIATINYSFSFAVNSNYTFIVEAVNGSNTADRANSSTLWMTVDTLSPNLTYNSNTDSNNSFLSRTFIFVNASASDPNNVSANVTFFLYNLTSGGLLRSNVTAFNTTNALNWTGLTDGRYTVNVTVNDSATNSNSTDNRTITLDTTIPALTYNSNTDSNNSFLSRTFIFVNVSASDINNGSSNVTFSLYNLTSGVLLRSNISNYSATSNNNTFNWTGLTDGRYILNITANDSAANSNTTGGRIITLDTTVPSLSYNSNTEANNSAAIRNYTFVNVSATDINNGSSNITFFLYNGTSGALLRSNISNYSATSNNNTFNWSNLIDGLYIFNVSANDSAGNSNSSDSRTFYLDTVNPSVSLPTYTNGTIKTNSTSLTLSVFVNDSLSGLTGALCLIDVNGTNQSITPSSGWCNGSVALTGLSDGNKTIKVYANDTAGNVALNNSFVVFMDSIIPTATASCSPSTIYEGDSFPCTCSGSDTFSITTSGSSTSGSITSTSTAGTFTYTCTVTDIAGNSDSKTATYTVLNLGGGGGSGGGGAATPKDTHSWSKITPGVVSIMKDFDSEIGVKEIQISVNDEAQNVHVTVTKYDGKPAGVSISKSGKVYQYLQIGTQNLESKLDKATVQFRVERSWASSNSLGKDEVSVYKFDETAGKWNELQTTFSSEDNTYYYYDTEVDSFSYFAISEKALVSGEGNDAGGTPTEEGKGNSLTFLWILIAFAIGIVVWRMRKK